MAARSEQPQALDLPAAQRNFPSPHHLQIQVAPGRAQRQNLALCPTISASQNVHLREQPFHKCVHLRPQETFDIEENLPTMSARRTSQLDLLISSRISLGNA